LRSASIMGSQVGDPQDFRDMLALIGEKRIKPVIERTFMLAEAREALLHLQDKHRFGKVVIRI
jgi:zinc-binding alcohol dehydrogenase/oxidoreductase